MTGYTAEGASAPHNPAERATDHTATPAFADLPVADPGPGAILQDVDAYQLPVREIATAIRRTLATYPGVPITMIDPLVRPYSPNWRTVLQVMIELGHVTTTQLDTDGMGNKMPRPVTVYTLHHDKRHFRRAAAPLVPFSVWGRDDLRRANNRAAHAADQALYLTLYPTITRDTLGWLTRRKFYGLPDSNTEK